MGFDMINFRVFQTLLDRFVHKYSAENPEVFIPFYMATIQAGVNVSNFNFSLFMKNNREFFKGYIINKNLDILIKLNFLNNHIKITFEDELMQMMIFMVKKNSNSQSRKFLEFLLAKEGSIVQEIFDFAESYSNLVVLKSNDNFLLNLTLVHLLVNFVKLEEELILKFMLEVSTIIKNSHQNFQSRIHDIFEKINRNQTFQNQKIHEVFLVFLNFFRFNCQGSQNYYVPIPLIPESYLQKLVPNSRNYRPRTFPRIRLSTYSTVQIRRIETVFGCSVFEPHFH